MKTNLVRMPRRGVGDFTRAGFPLPASPIFDPATGVGDFVNGGFPLPQNPVYVPSVAGSLPKAQDLTQADLAPLPAQDSCGMGCGCASCGGGMGSVLDDATGFISNAGSTVQTFLAGETYGVKNTYLAAGAVVALLFFMGGSRGGGRRRR